MAAKRIRKLEDFNLDADLAEVTQQAPTLASAVQVSAMAVSPAILAAETGTPGPDNYTGTDAADIYSGGKGRDVIDGQGGDDRLSGGADDDMIRGGTSITGDRLSGGAGDDELYGGSGNDLFRGGLGADRIDGDAGINSADYSDADFDPARVVAVFADLMTGIVHGGAVAEGDQLHSIQNLLGSAHPDLFWGDNLANRLAGNGGDDGLLGFPGADLLFGGAGDDSLYGGNDFDRDLLTGGAGTDTFFISLWDLVTLPPDDEGHSYDAYFTRSIGDDRIMDFVRGEDVIQIETKLGDPNSSTFGDLEITDISESSGFSGARLSFGEQGALLVRNVAAAELTEADIRITYL